jgi:hypothetical protein
VVSLGAASGEMQKGRLTNADRTKVADEAGLAEGVDVGDPLVEGEDDGQPAEDKDGDDEDNEPPDAERQVGIVELVERDDGADVDEGGHVEEQIDDVTEVRLLRLPVEETVPGKGRAAGKGGEQVVRTEQGGDACEG